ncbi:glycosyltransferase [Georgenia sp. TF02-10]|uniref:glycosyltransferase family 2 protein n=1 Tax=Georgenia sp. TF02-10 TaxID=2917725 RepID=UPI001FA6B81B|nr:glycosyltransferase [Georgenia sp. TF02-10]UNX55750.1 glycosyltransferase [Georgenia sp. TF02-10]
MRPRLTLVVAAPHPGAGPTAETLTADSFRAQGEGPWELVVAEDDGRPLSDRLNAAVAGSTGRYVAVLETGDRLEPGVLGAVVGLLTQSPAAEPGVLYTDEQWPAEGSAGIFTKPRWIPRYLEAYPYLGRLCFVRRDLFERVGGFREDFAPAREWDLALRITELGDPVVHVPVVGLVRDRSPVDAAAVAAGRDAVADRYARLGVPATVEVTGDGDGQPPGFLRVWRRVPDPPLVSVVIPTAGARREVRGADTVLVTNAVRSLVGRTTYPNLEVVLVPSEHTPPEVLQECAEILGDRLRVAPVAGEFNFSRSVNTGVGAARGELVLLLNDDTEVIEPRWLDRMVAVAAEDGVGVVGAKLLFADGRVQHTGVTFDHDGEARHVHIFEADDAGHFGSKVVDLDFLAVTGACLLVPRAVFVEVGGFSEALPLNYNDVDFCLKVGATGRRVVCTPFARLHHFESSSRRARIEDEERAALAWWDPRKTLDPYVNVRGV